MAAPAGAVSIRAAEESPTACEASANVATATVAGADTEAPTVFERA